MRVGIWCDYGFTLEPSEGIGVFVDNLARGLLQANSQIQLLMMPHPGQEEPLQRLHRIDPARVEIAARARPPRWRRRLLRQIEKVAPDALYGDKATRASWPAWQKWTSRLAMAAAGPYEAETQSWIKQCDLWLVPHVGISRRFSVPSVVLIHDLVSYHFPDVVKPRHLKRFQHQVAVHVENANQIACMSNFIRDNDLVKTLGLPQESVAVVKAAIPADQEESELANSERVDQLVGDRFLFYPAAFRTYKNHRLLVRLLDQLKRSPLWPMKIVFTGIRKCPKWLQQEIDAHDANEDVVALGKVSRQELVHLYRNAYATVVPTLYEQGSFPIMEAIEQKCPALCSDIPALREQFGPMGQHMLFFDPHDCNSVMEKLLHVEQDRSQLIRRQSESYAKCKERTWKDAGKDWISVFQSVLEKARQKKTDPTIPNQNRTHRPAA